MPHPERTVAAVHPADDVWAAAVFDAAGPNGPGGRSAPFTWGQRALWIALRRHGAEQTMINLRRSLPLPRRAAADLPSVLRAIGQLLVRHDSLRTLLRTVDGQPRQIVVATGTLPVLLVQAEEDSRVGTATAAVTQRLAGMPFDHAEELPQRIALVLTGERVAQIVVVFSHTTVDFLAAELVLRDLRILLVRGSIAAPAGLQSVDVALREDAEHRRRADRVVEHWLTGFSRLPTETIAYAGPPLEPRFQRAVLTSTAADTAARMIADRRRMTSSTVLLAATVAVLSRWAGDNAGDFVGVYTMVNNRSYDGYPDAIAKLNQLGLVVVDVSGRPSFTDLLPRVWRAALDAYRHAYYDPTRIADAFALAGFPYATGVSPHCYLNDMRQSTETDLFGRDTDPAALRRAASTSTLAWSAGFSTFTWRTRLEIIDGPGAIGFGLTADTAHLPPDAIERFLRDLERLLVEAACRDVPWPWM